MKYNPGKMDPDTEKQLAKLIMEEATRLRMQADREGVHAYLEKPKGRGRPNSQFLTATVRGVQQANRMVEVNEMWRVREKELELEKRMHAQKDRYSLEQHRSCRTGSLSCKSWDTNNSKSRMDADDEAVNSSESGEELPGQETFSSLENEGLRDEDIEDFLHSRVKRGRGAIGPRMDEPGPYPISHKGESSAILSPEMRVKEEWEKRVIGPSMPPLAWTDNSVAGLEKFGKRDSKPKQKRDRASRDSDKETKSKNSKKKHEKRRKSEKEKRKKEEIIQRVCGIFHLSLLRLLRLTNAKRYELCLLMSHVPLQNNICVLGLCIHFQMGTLSDQISDILAKLGSNSIRFAEFSP